MGKTDEIKVAAKLKACVRGVAQVFRPAKIWFVIASESEAILNYYRRVKL